MNAEVIAKTRESADHFFGFYDICPWSPDGGEVLALRYPRKLDRLPDGSDVAEVCVWNPASGHVDAVGETRAWNFQQGARSRWLRDGTILFNDLERGAECARIVTKLGRLVRTLPRAVYALSPSEDVALSPSFGRLGAYYSGYGYRCHAPSIADPRPSDDGVWAIDLGTGSHQLLISIRALADDAALPPVAMQFVSHMQFDSTGAQFLFTHTYVTSDGALFSRLMVSKTDGTGLQCHASETVSHPFWFDDRTIVLWARFSEAMARFRQRDVFRHPAVISLIRATRKWQGRLRNRLLNEGVYMLDVETPGVRSRILESIVAENGHFSRHPFTRLVVGDTYADRDNRLHLYVFDPLSGARIDLASFVHGVPSTDSDLRCDLHPRWDRTGRLVSVDTCEEGIRRMVIVDASRALRQLQGP